MSAQCQELQKAHDEDRRRFARALHDDAQQTLAAASMSLSMLERQASDLVDPARSTLKEAMALLARAHQELRVLAERLHPPLLDEMGLPTALRGLVLRVGKTRLDVEITSDLARFDSEVETAAFKLVDEALMSVFAENLPVKARLSPGEDGSLHVALSGVPVKMSDAEPAIARLSLRARGVGGRLRVHRTAARIKLEAVFAKGSERA